MKTPQWIPGRADVAGLALAMALGLTSFTLVRSLPASPYISDILIALVLGAGVINSPLRHRIGLLTPEADQKPDRYAAGLRFCGKWVLRLGIITMGLKVQTSFFGSVELALIAGVGFFTLPSAFFVTQALGSLTGIRQPLTDLLAGGTMICGASAVNAIAPISGSRHHEQGIAIAVMFLFSVVALACFRPIAVWIGLDPSFAGIWSGLAVNDLSSAIAVGSQMGGTGDVMAAAAKSARILMLTPTLIMFSLIRREDGPSSKRLSLSKHFPKFVLGYLTLAFIRGAGDHLFSQSPTWTALLTLNSLVVSLALSAVAASIGLHLRLHTLLTTSTPAVVVGAGASLTIASLSLAMITLASHELYTAAGITGAAGLLISILVYRIVIRHTQ
ncbi:MAG: putative sulfate exporter family transporter [bacterium]|nr:putative sulfate exporter family transporter [bacterium]